MDVAINIIVLMVILKANVSYNIPNVDLLRFELKRIIWVKIVGDCLVIVLVGRIKHHFVERLGDVSRHIDSSFVIMNHDNVNINTSHDNFANHVNHIDFINRDYHVNHDSHVNHANHHNMNINIVLEGLVSHDILVSHVNINFVTKGERVEVLRINVPVGLQINGLLNDIHGGQANNVRLITSYNIGQNIEENLFMHGYRVEGYIQEILKSLDG